MGDIWGESKYEKKSLKIRETFLPHLFYHSLDEADPSFSSSQLKCRGLEVKIGMKRVKRGIAREMSDLNAR